MMHVELQFSRASCGRIRHVTEHLRRRTGFSEWRIPETPHITLATSDTGYRRCVAGAELRRLALLFPPISVHVDRADHFRKPRGGAVYLAVSKTALYGVTELQQHVHRLLAQFGQIRSHHAPKRYIPHITLASRITYARVVEVQRYVEEVVSFPLTLTVDRIVYLRHPDGGFPEEARRDALEIPLSGPARFEEVELLAG